jgi:molybdate/tungstate transport system ATP-binding protein
LTDRRRIILTLKVEHVSKTLGTFRLIDVCLEVKEGEYFVLLGPTGAGKTVLLDLIMGFHFQDKGRITLNGRNILNVPTDKRGIAYVPQNCPLFPHISVFDNVEFGLKMRRMPSAERKKTVNQMIRVVGLESLAGRMPSTLSGGERQKVVLARVLVTKPKIILLDEPLTAIDAETSRSFLDELKRINREFKVGFLHVTHDQIEAFSLADKMAIMMEGKIVQVGEPNEVLSNPANELVARFLGYENVFRVSIVKRENGISEVNANGVSIKLNGEIDSGGATIAIRPEDIVITTETPPVSLEWNSLEGTIKGHTNLGPIFEVVVDAGLILKVIVDKRSFLEFRLFEKKQVHVGFMASSVKVVGMH